MKHLEDAFQVQVVQFFERAVSPLDAYIFAVPNGGKRGKIEGARFKTQGVRAGVADLVIMLEWGKTAFLELKSPSGTVSPAQRVFRATCERLGHPYGVCKTLEEVESFLRDTLSLRLKATCFGRGSIDV